MPSLEAARCFEKTEHLLVDVPEKVRSVRTVVGMLLLTGAIVVGFCLHFGPPQRITKTNDGSRVIWDYRTVGLIFRGDKVITAGG